ncbi:MAG: hypothetical protein IH872_04385 [Chloroflexi bacterium]|nr:hypothetical protein [Chloroflexota bacterium]
MIQGLARSIDTPTPVGDLAFKIFTKAAEAGLGDLGAPIVVQLLTQEAGVEVRRKSGD